LGRPVKYTATRSECFISDYQGRDLVAKYELALDERGRFLALRATNISNAGARCVSLSPLSKGAGLITGNYDIPVASLRALSVFTNTVPTQAYRSSGRPEVTFAIERLIDIAAKRLGIDRVSLRRRNLVKPKAMPYRNAVGMLYDSGRYEENMDLAMQLADWAGFKARRRDAKKSGKLLGLGLANYVESSIGAPKEQTRIKISPDHRVEVVIGTQPAGQGHQTSFAQVVADLITVPVETVHIILGDTDIVKAGGGTHSGRSMRHAATVFSLAATELIAKGKRVTAMILDTPPDRVDFSDGRFMTRDSNRSFDFFELAYEMTRHKMPEDLSAGLEIDPESCSLRLARYTSVDDVGRCINPLIVDGQTHGAIVQGIGQALWEQCVVDPAGQPLCGSFMDYGMPRSDRLPSFVTKIVEVLSPTNPLGIKAGGEGGTTGAPAAIVSAIADALAPYGIDDIKMPVTPYRIWDAIHSRKTPTSL
jgi:carbon-monoxide dehydrogenase large subunit